MLKSIVKEIGPVEFPAFTGERVYMLEIFKDKPLPESLARWEPTVAQMLVGVDTVGPVYLMIDQKVVKATETHRRPGMHIDGFWMPEHRAHGPSHIIKKESRSGRHGRPEYWQSPKGVITANGIHYTPPTPIHQTRPSHSASADIWPNETIILASNVSACRALVGDWEGEIGAGGDVSHLAFSNLQEIQFKANIAYAGNVTFVHESLPVPQDVCRTVVRLNVPGHVII